MAIEVLCLPFNNAHLWCHDLSLCDICVNDKLGCYHKHHFISFSSTNYLILLDTNVYSLGFVSFFQQFPLPPTPPTTTTNGAL